MTPFNTLTSWCRHGTMRALCFLSKLWQKQKKITSNVAVRFENSWWKEKKKVFKFLNWHEVCSLDAVLSSDASRWSRGWWICSEFTDQTSDVKRSSTCRRWEKILILSCLERSMSSSQSRVTLNILTTWCRHDTPRTFCTLNLNLELLHSIYLESRMSELGMMSHPRVPCSNQLKNT